MSVHTPLLVAALLAAASVAAAERSPRYGAMLANGQRIEGNKLSDWHDAKALPRLDGQALMEPSNPLRWLRDRTRQLAELPAAYVEFAGGDRLPGVVVDYKTGHEDPFTPLPPHLIVRVALDFEPPNNRPVREIRVLTQFVRRIVWQRRGGQADEPGTAIYRDGRSVAFRALRHRAGEVHLLLSDGDRRIDWSELAEVHLPASDPWDDWFDQLALLCPNIDTRLIELETTTGLLAMASQARWAPRFEGNSADSDRWVHGIQPAWSLDILWVPFREVAYYRSYSPREVPLTRLGPRRSQSQRGIASGRPPRVNRNVLGTPLRSRSLDFGFGHGVSGGDELGFDLHAGVRSLRAWVCLDRAAAGGGCIRPRIYAGEAKGNPLWEGPVIVGSETVADTGAIALPGPDAEQRSIVLQMDPMIQGKPAGADPLDIRDHANWCDPLLELDPAAVQRELDRRLAQRLALDRQWTAEPLFGTPAEAGLAISFHRTESIPGSFEPAALARERPLVLRRRMTIGPRDNWLVIAAVRPPGQREPANLEVRIGGEPVGEFKVPQGSDKPHDVRPLAVSLAGYEQTSPLSVDVEVRQTGEKESAAVQYQAILASEQLPTLHCVLEEQAGLEPLDRDIAGSAEMVTDDRHYGVRSLRIASPARFRLPLDRIVRIRERPAWGEARFIRFAVKKPSGGRFAIEFEDAQPREPPARYDLGQGEPSYGNATRIWQDKLPKDWVVMTRDLYADFGNVDLQGLIFGCPDGEAALVDHFYLARTHSDFELIPAAPVAELVNAKAREELARPIVERVGPAVVRIEYADGRQAAGVLIDEKGEILTVGHAVIGPDRDCLVTLADGTTVAGRTRGVARDYDLGLVRLVQEGKHRAADVRPQEELPQNQPYLAFVHWQRTGEFQPPASCVVEIRRALPASVWIDLEERGCLSGGPVIDRDGRLVGLQTGQSRFGGVLCNRLHEAWKELPRLRNGEVFGAWPPHSEPVLGIDVEADGGKLRVVGVEVEGPEPAFVAGDVLVKIDGQAIATEHELRRLLAQRDAGQELVAELLRGEQTRQLPLRLLPRQP